MMLEKSSCSQIKLITRITAAGCLAGMLLCPNLWLSERNFPLSPVLRILPQLQHPADYLLFGLSFLCLAGIILLRNPRKFIIAFTIIAVLLALLDQNRWQPWFYQYLLMLAVLAGFNFRCDDDRQQLGILWLFRLMIAAIYFWSGLQKLNPNFLADTFPWLMEPVTKHLGEESLRHFSFLGKAFPLIEILTGILLLVPATRKAAAIAAVLMHLFILFTLGPAGHNYNQVVWPWNIAMIVFNLVLFYRKETAPFSPGIVLRFHIHKVVALLFLLMPLFNFFGHWDSYLSHNLYSGNTSDGAVYLSENVRNRLPLPLRNYAVGDSVQYQINLKYWCMMELGVPAYPEKRNFEAVAAQLYQYAPDSSEIYFVYDPKISLK